MLLLVGDIGGTKTELAVVSPEQGIRAPIARNRFPSGDYPSLEAIARQFLADEGISVQRAVFAVAGPVVDGRAVLTNLPWVLEESLMQATLGIETVRLLNDVEAMAAAVPHLQPSDVLTLQPGEPSACGAIAVIAAGTGLGEAFLTWDGTRYRAHPSEGSHTNFGPTTPHETELLRYLQARWGRVSYERVCAGRSIPDLYDFLKDEGRRPESARVRPDSLPRRTLRPRSSRLRSIRMSPIRCAWPRWTCSSRTWGRKAVISHSRSLQPVVCTSPAGWRSASCP